MRSSLETKKTHHWRVRLLWVGWLVGWLRVVGVVALAARSSDRVADAQPKKNKRWCFVPAQSARTHPPTHHRTEYFVTRCSTNGDSPLYLSANIHRQANRHTARHGQATINRTPSHQQCTRSPHARNDRHSPGITVLSATSDQAVDQATSQTCSPSQWETNTNTHRNNTWSDLGPTNQDASQTNSRTLLAINA